MGYRMGSLACRVCRRLEGTIHPRQRIPPSGFNLGGRFIAPGALRSPHREGGGAESEGVPTLRSAADMTLPGGKPFAAYLSGGTATIAGAARSMSHPIPTIVRVFISPPEQDIALIWNGCNAMRACWTASKPMHPASAPRGLLSHHFRYAGAHSIRVTCRAHRLRFGALHPKYLGCFARAYKQRRQPHLMDMSE